MYKQPPIWIINSTLLLFFICTLTFILLTRYTLPARVRINVPHLNDVPDNELSKIDISQIYTNDLFNTYKDTPIKQAAAEEEKRLMLPPPPALKPAIKTEAKPVQFLEPLAITLKGIIYSTHEEHNRAIIEENKSHQEKLYKVGDVLEDAEIVRIYYNKIMIIRSNGQQETLFMSSQDEQKDPLYKNEPVWHTIIQKKSSYEFMIDKNGFIQAIKNLAEFIDMLDITTAFKRGKSIGCRIGVLKPKSVGEALGLLPNDIILTIQDISTTTTNDRVEIFTRIKNMGHDDTIEVRILRQNEEILHKYGLLPEVHTPQKDSVSDNTIPEELRHMYDISTKLVEESQLNKNPMVEATYTDNLARMAETPIEESPLLQQVPT